MYWFYNVCVCFFVGAFWDIKNALNFFICIFSSKIGNLVGSIGVQKRIPNSYLKCQKQTNN